MDRKWIYDDVEYDDDEFFSEFYDDLSSSFDEWLDATYNASYILANYDYDAYARWFEKYFKEYMSEDAIEMLTGAERVRPSASRRSGCSKKPASRKAPAKKPASKSCASKSKSKAPSKKTPANKTAPRRR